VQMKARNAGLGWLDRRQLESLYTLRGYAGLPTLTMRSITARCNNPRSCGREHA